MPGESARVCARDDVIRKNNKTEGMARKREAAIDLPRGSISYPLAWRDPDIQKEIPSTTPSSTRGCRSSTSNWLAYVTTCNCSQGVVAGEEGSTVPFCNTLRPISAALMSLT